MSDIQIRALMQIDNLQPKFAAYNGATVQGSVPLSGDTVLIGEFAPGNGVFSDRPCFEGVFGENYNSNSSSVSLVSSFSALPQMLVRCGA